MHQPYKVCQLLRLPSTIESITALGDLLLVGTKEGHLLMYSVDFNEGNEVEVTLVRSSNKCFGNKSIQKLEAVAECSIVVALSNSNVTVHDIDLSATTFPVITSLPRTKGASTFALDVIRVKSLTNEVVCTVRLVVAVKRSLQLYYWKNRKFLELQPDINLPDYARSLAWCKDSICVGYRSDYGMVKLTVSPSFELCELFPTGRNQPTSVTLMADERFALGKDDQTNFVDLQSTLALDSLTWSDVPLSVSHDPPFLVACLKNSSVEVRTESPKLLLQNVPLSNAIITSTVPNHPGVVYVASAKNYYNSTSVVWCLKMVPVSIQIPQLLNSKQFELAILLTNVCEANLDDKVQRLQQIQILYAFDLFSNRKFKEALDLFFKLDVDATNVIGLYTDLTPFPSEFRSQLKFPEKLPKFEESDLKVAYAALVEYLTSVRHKLQGSSARLIAPVPLTQGSITVKSRKQIMEVLDTTLLLCYLEINDSLVASLLRLKSNQCNAKETERALKKKQKYSELIIFYNTKGLHQKALQLLAEQSDLEDSPLYGTDQTVKYLQNLGPEEIDLVCEHAGAVLDKSFDEGLKIFTDDLHSHEVENWPRNRIFGFLQGHNPEAVIPYLEHIINVWKDTTPIFHNALIIRYTECLKELYNQAESTFHENRVLELRRKLREFLAFSQDYNADNILPNFPTHCLHEERALLLGSKGDHKTALALYLYQVHDIPAAQAYCQRHFKEGSEVYTTLYNLLVAPPDPFALKAMYVSHANAHSKIEPDIKTGLKLLEEHGTKVDLQTVLTSTPAYVPLADILPFLESTLEQRVSHRHQMQLLRGLMHADYVEAEEERIELESQKIEVDEEMICPVCFKRFRGQSAIVRFPDGRLVHYSCQAEASLRPS